MKKKLLSKNNGERTFILVLEDGEEAFGAISRFAAAEQIGGASLSAIGAFGSAVIGFFDFATKTYNKIPVREQCEVLSGIGDIAIGDDGKPSVHLHAVLGLSDGSTRGGHFMEGTVHPTLEVVVREAATNMCRRTRSDLGIALLDP